MLQTVGNVTPFRRAPAGQRFQARYWQHRSGGRRRSWLARVISLATGSIIAAAGLLMLVLPGPGLLALVVAGGFFASESLVIARLLDRGELVARRLWRRIRARWRRRR